MDPFALDIPYLVLTGRWTSVSAQAVAVTKNDIYIYIMMGRESIHLAYPDLSIMPSRCKIITVRAEADATYTTLG